MKDCNITSFLTIKKNKIKLTVRVENVKSCKTHTYTTSDTLSFNDCLAWKNKKIKEAINKHSF